MRSICFYLFHFIMLCYVQHNMHIYFYMIIGLCCIFRACFGIVCIHVWTFLMVHLVRCGNWNFIFSSVASLYNFPIYAAIWIRHVEVMKHSQMSHGKKLNSKIIISQMTNEFFFSNSSIVDIFYVCHVCGKY